MCKDAETGMTWNDPCSVWCVACAPFSWILFQSDNQIPKEKLRRIAVLQGWTLLFNIHYKAKWGAYFLRRLKDLDRRKRWKRPHCFQDHTQSDSTSNHFASQSWPHFKRHVCSALQSFSSLCFVCLLFWYTQEGVCVAVCWEAARRSGDLAGPKHIFLLRPIRKSVGVIRITRLLGTSSWQHSYVVRMNNFGLQKGKGFRELSADHIL